MNSFERPGAGGSGTPLPGNSGAERPPAGLAGAREPRVDSAGFARRGFADQLSIETPEQVALVFPVAGLGSRFVALLLDHLIQFGAVVVVGLLLAAVAAAMRVRDLESLASKWLIAGVTFALFLLFWGYFALFEAFWHGQTPGKRAMQLRVIKDAGRQITLFESLARNLLRAVDYLPVAYLAGVITMLCNRRNKRLGDLAAGTIVVHERGEAQPLLYTGPTTGQTGSSTRLFPVPAPRRDGSAEADAWRSTPGTAAAFAPDALLRLSGQDLVIVEAFFARALDLPLDTRATMAARIAGEMAAKMGVGLPEGNPERVLESLAAALRGSRRRFPG